MAALTKEDLDKFKNVDPTGFLSKPTIEKEDDVIEPTVKKEEGEKPTPAKELKTQLEKTKKERADIQKKFEEAEARIKELEAKTGEASELEALRPVAEYLKKKAGKLDADVVEKELIQKNRERKKQLVEKDEKLSLKDKQIQEISIEHSEEWQEDYVKPINESRDNLVASIVNLDNEGKIRNPELMHSLMQRLVMVNDQGVPKTSLEIKQELKAFANEYEKKTGLEYDFPILREVVDAVSVFHNKVISASKAKADWQQSVENKRKEREFEQVQQRQSSIKKEIEARDYYFNRYKADLKIDELEDILDDPDDFIAAAAEEHKFLKAALSGDSSIQPRQYNEFIDLAAKGKMFDALTKKVRELQRELKSFRKDEKSPKFNGGAKASVADGEKLTKDNIPAGYNPTGFLQR